jgi:hypothetical protein
MAAVALTVAAASAFVALCCLIQGGRAERRARWQDTELHAVWVTLGEHDLAIDRLESKRADHLELIERN